MNAPIKIAIAEDNAMLLNRISKDVDGFSEFKVKHQAESGNKLLEMLANDSLIDLVLMDIEMANGNGIETTETIKNLYPQIKVLMLTVLDDSTAIFKAIRAGANGYLLKDEPAENLKAAILDIMAGGASMTPSIANKAMKLLRNAPIEEPVSEAESFALSERETSILEQLCKGRNYKEIANNLVISPGTVRKHIENVYRKLHVHNKAEAIRLAYKSGLV
ncbi:MAG: response regulator transcription factor [Bacteroidetes bacterium]|nr:response regulator transcription factor [Bacteroidota bacterium]